MEDRKVALITGASSGVGKAIAISLAQKGLKIVMLCRDVQRGEAARTEIAKESGNNDIELMICDLGHLNAIRNFADEFLKTYDKLHILINNAGVILPGRHLTEDGYELQFGVNFVGPFLLTHLLQDLMIHTGNARIVNVSSDAHKFGKMHWEDIMLQKHYRVFKAYAQSKLALTLFTYELARRLNNTGLTVNCLHPGAVATNMGINRNTGFGMTITKLLKPFFLTPAEGAETAIYLAVSEEVEGITGKYFYKGKAVPSSKKSYDPLLALKVWEEGMRLSKIDKQ